jgi:hypothetical protein
MPTRTNKRTGEVQEMRDGQWVTIKPGAGIQTRGPDPLLPSKVTTARNQAAASASEPAKAAADARIAQLEAQIKGIQAGNAGALSAADLEKARLEVQKLQAELSGLKSGKGGAMKALQDQIDRVTSLYQNNLQGGMPNVVNRVVPDSFQPGKAQFDTAAEGLTNPFMAAFRIPGVGSQSDTELRQFISANVPQQGDSDAVIEEKIRNIQTRINAEKPAQPVAEPPAAPQMQQSSGKTESKVDPALKALGQRVGRMVANGANDATVIDFIKKNGVDPASTNIDGVLQFRKTPDFKAWQRANPGKSYPIGPEFYTKDIPLTGGRALFNKTAATDGGGALAAGLVSSANAISGGRLDNAVGALSGDPEMARTGMELLRTNHPVASVAGDLAGQASTEAALSLIPGAQGLMATRLGRRGSDLAYGAYSGSGEDDDNPLSGALTGALTNAGFGMAGRSAQRGVGRAMTGVRNANLSYLNARDVPLTLGQIARGSENVVGNAVGGLEERARGLPGMDAVIGAARQRGDKGFNRAAFRELGTSGATGAKGVLEGQNLVNGAYSFLDPITMPVDAQFAGTNAGVRANLPRNLGSGIADRLDTIDNAVVNGGLPGRAWQDAVRGVKADRASLRGQPFSDQAINSLNDVEGNLQDLALRQGPPDTAANLANANKLNAQFQTLVSALDNGPAQKADELFSAGRLDDASRANARNFGGRTASIAGNRPFYDLTTAGKEVMPSLTPDSGTAGRILLVPAAAAAAGSLGGFLSGDDKAKDAATGGGIGLGGGLTLAALLSAPYTKGGQKVIQRALLGKRNRQITKLGDLLINNPRLSGLLGSALGRDFVYQPELPE